MGFNVGDRVRLTGKSWIGGSPCVGEEYVITRAGNDTAEGYFIGPEGFEWAIFDAAFIDFSAETVEAPQVGAVAFRELLDAYCQAIESRVFWESHGRRGDGNDVAAREQEKQAREAVLKAARS